MFKKSFVYTTQQVELMWKSVAYRDCRRFAFFDGTRWQHPNITFDTCEQFELFLRRNRITDVHVKPLEDDGGREWVIDVDVEDIEDLDVKICIAAETFRNFFGENVARVMHSGNRGIHVWLRIDRFFMHAPKDIRDRYYKVFVAPKELTKADTAAAPEGSFVAAFVKATQKYDSRCRHKPLLNWWPAVDKHVFCNNSQIRVPYSYNYKGKKFSYIFE
ncbi:late expression factor 1 [Alphabaculovirus altersperidaniae]|uniref:Late expression factor 1 n=1 Tax=Spodoptera eridania nucleopolyhedrovirus TaxID=2315721 RepID=A0ABX6TQ28_9ABAC|nr:late expression factor 1 [Spodoptera eridania nucleopolyhedrovirus]QNV47856.1 late expression factor 1 [Spodoptera eridania nucleopolyhedrovirus]